MRIGTQRERERCVHALGEQDLAQQYRRFSETRFGRFFEGKKVAKGVCNVAKLATLCISISPATGRATGQTENALTLTVINALTLTALIYIYIYKYMHSLLNIWKYTLNISYVCGCVRSL